MKNKNILSGNKKELINNLLIFKHIKMSTNIKQKTIVLDVDGTLVKPKSYCPSKKVKQSLHKEIEAGNEIVIATGRPLKNALSIIEAINKYPITVLSSNGNLTVNLPSRKIISYHPLNKDLFIPLIFSLVKQNIRAFVVLANKSNIEKGISYDTNARVQDYYMVKTGDTNTYGFVENENDKILCEELRSASTEEIKKMADWDIMNIHAHLSNERETDKLIESLKVFENEETIVKKAAPTIVEMFNPKVDKGYVLEEIGYKGLVVYIGDSENDISGIQWAIKHKGFGVAMGNAFDSVKSKSNFVTTSLDEDGVSYALDYINQH